MMKACQSQGFAMSLKLSVLEEQCQAAYGPQHKIGSTDNTQAIHRQYTDNTQTIHNTPENTILPTEITRSPSKASIYVHVVLTQYTGNTAAFDL